MAKEIVETSDKAVASYDYGDMAHAGFEGTKITDLSIPFINVLQANSPEVEEQTVKGAGSGDLLNSVTKEILKQPLIVQPVFREEAWIEWVPRNKGGGLAGRHEPNSEIVSAVIKKNNGSRIPPQDADGKRPPFRIASGNDLVETYYVYCLILDEEGKEVDGYCVLAFSSTKIKVYKNWLTAMYTQKGSPPIFANRAAISTVRQKAEGGNFYNYNIGPYADNWRDSLIDPSNEIGEKLLKGAQDFRKMISEGLARPDYTGTTGDDAVEGAKDKPTKDDEMPF